MRSHIVGEENEAFFIRVWKSLPSRHVLKSLKRSPKGNAQRGQYLLAVGLGYYKWYWLGRCVSEEAERERTKHFFIRVWKPLPSQHVLKTLRGSLKGKAQRGQYLLAVGLGRYNLIM